MNIQILDSWLRAYLETNAKPKDLAKALSLCGPSIERIHPVGDDYQYDIEITTNRVDMASVFGIAREAVAILPRFGFKAKLKLPKYNLKNYKPASATKSITIKVDPKLTKRVMGAVMEVDGSIPTPSWMKERLVNAGIRSLSPLVDITNYIMLEVGHPTHVFDYDRIPNKKLIFRQSQQGETTVGLDGKIYMMPGGDIVIDDGKGQIIDIPGILGTQNSVVTPQTKKILFFIDSNDPVLMRKTSMSLALRTVAVTLNEKGVDPNLAEDALAGGIELYKKICKGKLIEPIYDQYPTPTKEKTTEVSLAIINKLLGIDVDAKEVTSILSSLGFGVVYSKSNQSFKITIPSLRLNDIQIPEDIVEEVARIYGYHNLPSVLPTGRLPEKISNSPFEFEMKVKRTLKALGATEVYTLSLVTKEMAGKGALKLRNPLGSDSEYLRTNLTQSLLLAAKENNPDKNAFHIFEMANVYLPNKVSAKSSPELPDEKMTLAGIITGGNFREAKGTIEALLTGLRTDSTFLPKDNPIFKKDQGLAIGKVGIAGNLENSNLFYYEFEIEALALASSNNPKYQPIPKYPAQVEDITFDFQTKAKIGDEIKAIYLTDKLIANVELKDIYESSHTFRIYYQDPEKTLSNSDVEKVREKVMSTISKKFGATVK